MSTYAVAGGILLAFFMIKIMELSFVIAVSPENGWFKRAFGWLVLVIFLITSLGLAFSVK